MNCERRIIVIQPNMKASKNTASRTKLRVAAYCRVSTEEEEQQGSFEIQKEFYTAKNQFHPRMAACRDLRRRWYLRCPHQKA